MPEFTSFEELADALSERLAAASPGIEEYSEIADLIAADARKRVGEYQQALGPFPAWQPLSAATQQARVKLGFTPNDPLLRSGEMQRAIEPKPTAFSAIVAVPSKIVEDVAHKKPVDIGVVAEAQEHGTPSIPPRPFLGPALWAMREAAMALIRRSIARKLGE